MSSHSNATAFTHVAAILALVIGHAGNSAACKAADDSGVDSLVGFWECIDPDNHLVLRTVELTKDGARVDVPRFGQNPGMQYRPGLKYRTSGDMLEFYHYERSNKPLIEESGRIRWIDTRLFNYTFETGYRFVQGKTYEFHRLSGPDDPQKAGSIVGAWEVSSSKPDHRPYTLILMRDGKCKFIGQSSSDRFFKYVNRMLYLLPDPDISLSRSNGVVSWTDKDHFVLKYANGLETYTPRELSFRRLPNQVSDISPPQPLAPESPGGQVGDYVGLWESVRPTSHIRIRVFEFNPDGTFRKLGMLSGAVEPVREGRAFRYNGQRDSLALFNAPGGQQTLLENGHVKWVDGDMFVYEPQGGNWMHPNNFPTPSRAPQEFRRLGSKASKDRSILGTWIVDKKASAPHGNANAARFLRGD